MKKYTYIFIIIFSLFSFSRVGAQTKEFELSKSVDLFFSAYKEIHNLYVDSIGPDEFMKHAIEGVVNKMDPYSEYIPEKEKQDFDFMTTGKYGGVGSFIQQDSTYARIASPHKGFPADRAGLVAGDRLLMIDGENLKGLELSKVSDMLRGDIQTDLTLQVKKFKTGDTLNLKLTRESIKISSVSYSGIIDDSIGYIKLVGFKESSGKEFREALIKLQETGMLKSLIIDLRSNGGGSLDEVVKITNLFVPKGIEIVTAKGRAKYSNLSYKTTDEPLALKIPLAVLVNSGSASASEILAGAIQDLDRGIILGKRTFGKGLIQAVRSLGYESQIKFTTAKYYIPSGRCIQAHNFSQRNADGSVAFIPDSLKKEFQTIGGRKVYDGGGIAPDITVEPEYYSPITLSLLRKNLIFEYSLNFFKKNNSIATPDKFNISDKVFNEFLTYISDKDYDYETGSERMLKQLETIMERERYDSIAKNEIIALSNKLKHNKETDLKISKEELKNLLREEIVERYYYSEGRIRAMVRSDNYVQEAIALLNNSLKYNNLLSVVIKSKD